MGLALLTATRATCLRRRVGCVLLNARGHVLSTGYNGVAAGRPHCNEVTDIVDVPGTNKRELFYGHACSGAQAPSGQGLDACQAIHAEQNALLQCRDVYAIQQAFVTASPCITCTKLLLNTACEEVIFLEAYPHGEAQALWEGAGRRWRQVSPHAAQAALRLAGQL